LTDTTVDMERFEGSKAYTDPVLLAAAVEVEQHNLAAALKREGAQISEINHVTSDQLHGLREDPCTGELKGWVEVEGKGGKEREIGVSLATYARLEAAVAVGQRFEFDKDAYRSDLKEAAAKTGQDYKELHGFRFFG
jgi:site-specific recombinase XerC